MSRTHYRTCTLCEATCGIAIELDGRDIVSIRGDEQDPFSKGYICPKAAALKDLHEDPDRLRTPIRRHGSDWTAIAWDEAFDLVAHRLKLVQRAYGRDAVAVYQGNPTAHNLGLMTFGQVFLRRLGTRNMYSATSADQLPHMLSSLLMFGNQVLFPIPDIDRTDFMLIMGGNPVVSNGSIMTAPGVKRRLKAIRERGGQIVVVDPRRSETAALADKHLFIRPGSDALLLLAMLHVIYAEDLTSLGHLSEICDDEHRIRELVAEFSPEDVAAACDVDAQDIRALARDFAAARSAVCYGRVGVSTQAFGALCSWLINVLNIVTGNFDRVGGAMFTTPAVDVAAAAARSGHGGGFRRFRSRVSGLPEFGGELPISVLAEEIETPGQGQIRALVTSAGNPVLSIANGARLEKALETLDFMVSIDFYLNETTRHADIILPPTGPLEHDHYDVGFYLVSVRNIAKYVPALVERGPDQRHDWEISLELASRMETNERWWGRIAARAARAAARRIGVRGVLEAGLRLGPYKGLSVKKLERNPHGLDLGPLVPRLPDYLYTPDKRIRLAPSEYFEDIDRLRAYQRDRLRAYQRKTANGELVLIGRRQLRSNNSWMHNSYRLVKGKDRCTLLMHPQDAAARGLENGDRITLQSRVGSVEAPVEITDDMKPGVVSLPHGWGHTRPGTQLSVAAEHPGVSLNDVTDDGFYDELCGNISFSGIPVEVRKVAASAAPSLAGSAQG